MLSDDVLVAFRGYGRTSVDNIPVIVLIYALAAISWAWFEKPLLDMKGRFPYRASDARETESHADVQTKLSSLGDGQIRAGVLAR